MSGEPDSGNPEVGIDQPLESIAVDPRKFSLLIADDDPVLLLMARHLVRGMFETIRSCVDGQEAWEAYQSGTYDIVLTDIEMPRKNGLALAAEILKKNQEQKIVLMSAHTDPKYLFEAIRLGIECYILKPFEEAQFRASISSAIHSVKSVKENVLYRHHLEELVRERTAQLELETATDDLTGLLNRRMLLIAIDKDPDQTVFLANIDNFNHVNEGYGLLTGDKFLRWAGALLTRAKPDGSRVFRLRGDEFAITMPRRLSPEEMADVADNIILAFETTSFLHEGLEFSTSVTVGAAHGMGADVLHKADIAIKEARMLGGCRYNAYKAGSTIEATQKMNTEWIHRIRAAIQRDQLLPVFQPIVDNRTCEVDKFECLMRLQDGDSLVAPGLFLGAAETARLLPKMTRSLFRKVFKAFSGTAFQFSLNLSEQDFRDGYLLEFLPRLSDEFSIAPHRVTLEILETVASAMDASILDQIRRLQGMGYRFALDDFGTGSSNFSRLQVISVDFIKIDGSFIRDLDKSPESQRVVRTMVEFSKDIGAEVVAEYVHSKEVFEIVCALEVGYSQGYYFSPPKNVLDESKLLSSVKRLVT